MNTKLVTPIAVGLLAVLIVWQEVRIRGLESRLREAPEAAAIPPVAPVGPGPAELEREWPATEAPGAEVRPRRRERLAAADLQEEPVLDRDSPFQRTQRPGVEEGELPEGAVAEKVAELVAKEVDRRDAERWDRRRTRSVERATEAVTEFAQEHELDEGVSAQLVTMVTAEREQMMELFRQAREGDIPRAEVREKIGEIRSETDTNVEAILDDDEAFADYQKRREEERGPWRGGRRRSR